MDYHTLANKESIAKTAPALTANGIETVVVGTKEAALEEIKKLIPQGASVMNGSSRTLEEIGYISLLQSGAHGWNNLHAAILAETDKTKQAALRRQAVFSDFYLGSVHAITEGGELLVASGSGSQLPALAFTAKNIIIVAGAQKIVPTLADAFSRLNTYVYPLEDKRMKDAGQGGSTIAKILIVAKEPAWMGRTVRLILVNEPLGF
ncbi:MAG: lactate utilization protein [Minisyncoccia bacterium]|jgi:L-lactate utilization protein LutC